MSGDVVVVQHGDKVRAAGDPGLTELGHAQAAAVAAWLAHAETIAGVWASPLRRARETAAPIAAAAGVEVQVDDRLRERMNWDGEPPTIEEFLAEWERATFDRTYVPRVGDSSEAAARRFLDAVVDIAATTAGTAVVVSHGGVTVDALRTLVGDAELATAAPTLLHDGVPCGAITRLAVTDAGPQLVRLPSTDHLPTTSDHRRV